MTKSKVDISSSFFFLLHCSYCVWIQVLSTFDLNWKISAYYSCHYSNTSKKQCASFQSLSIGKICCMTISLIQFLLNIAWSTDKSIQNWSLLWKQWFLWNTLNVTGTLTENTSEPLNPTNTIRKFFRNGHKRPIQSVQTWKLRIIRKTRWNQE